MRIVFTDHDRKLFMKRFIAAEEFEHPEDMVTIFHVSDGVFQQDLETV